MVRYGLPPVNPATRNFEEDFHPMVRGRDRGRTNPGVGSMRGNPRGRYESIFKSVFPSAHNFDSIEIGARLKTFSDRWEAVTDDPWVLDTVVNGLRIDFIGKPTQHFPPHNVDMTEEMRMVCDAEVASLLDKKAISEVVDSSLGFFCSFFCIPKKSGGLRPIVNLKPLNKFIKYEHFKMENLKTVRFLVKKGDYFIKLDLKDAYLTVPICKSHQNYLRFAWRGRIFQFHCMAFGLSPAPRVFY
jgi:hypothetical protein